MWGIINQDKSNTPEQLFKRHTLKKYLSSDQNKYIGSLLNKSLEISHFPGGFSSFFLLEVSPWTSVQGLS